MLLFQKYFGYVDRSSLSMRCDKTMWKCAPSGKVVCLDCTESASSSYK
jgi:hypothetical protein